MPYNIVKEMIDPKTGNKSFILLNRRVISNMGRKK